MLTVAGNNKYMKQIQDINVDSYFDLCCKVNVNVDFFSIFIQFEDFVFLMWYV